MTWPEFFAKLLSVLEPYIPFAFALLFLGILIKITDRSLLSTVREIIRELPSLGQMNPKGMNVLGGILTFAIAVFLYFAGLAHIVLPDGKHAASASDVSRIVSLLVVVAIASYFIVCITVTKNRR